MTQSCRPVREHAGVVRAVTVLATLALVCSTSAPAATHAAAPSHAPAGQEPPSSSAPSREQADAFRRQGDAQRQRGDLPGALDSLNQALTIYRQLTVGTGQRAATTSIGWVNYDLGRTLEARTWFEQALDLARRIDDRGGESDVLNALGWTHQRLGERDTALDYHTQALTVAERLGDRAREQNALIGTGAVYRGQADYERALEYLQRALEIARQIGSRTGERSALQNMGSTFASRGEHARALEYLEQALSLAREIGDRTAERTALGDMTWAYINLSQYLRALETAQESLALARAIGNRGGEQNALDNLGDLYNNVGQYPQAEQAYRQALAIAQETRSRGGERVAYRGIGTALSGQGRYAEALEAYQQGLAVARAIADRRGEALSLATIGLTYNSMGQYAAALDPFQQALTVSQEIGYREGEHIALIGMGRAYNSLRDYGNAEAVLQESLRLARAEGRRIGEARALMVLGLAYEAQNDLTRAMDAYRQSILAREDVRTSAGVGEFRQDLDAQAAVGYQRAALLALRLGEAAEAFDLAERGRARALLDQLGNVRPGAGNRAGSALAQQGAALRAEIDALDQQVRRESTGPARLQNSEQIGLLREQLANKQREYETLLTQLKLADPETAALVSVAPLSLAEVQALLDADTTLLAYFVAPGATLAFVVTRDGFEAVRLPVREQELGELVQQFRAFASPADATGLLARLSASILAPVADWISTPVVGIVPHGSLHYLPFAALPDGPALFGETHTLFSLPSASTLPFVQQKRKASADRVLALSQSQPSGFPALRFADVEAESIARLYDGSALTGSAATETAFKAQAGQAPIVHVAAHAELNEHAPLFSRILLAPDGQNDGSLTVQEVYGLDLARADLVVLSACETQLGAQSRGDELVGLNRAFIYAGAPTVIASLWSVDDEATAVLMTAFYRQLRQGASKAGALQAAQAETRARYSHPYYWAAFVLTGDPGAPRVN